MTTLGRRQAQRTAAHDVVNHTGASYVTALAEVRRRDDRGELTKYMDRIAMLPLVVNAGNGHAMRCVRCLEFLIPAHPVEAGRVATNRVIHVHQDETPAGRCEP